jgi:hypothetical protein
MTVPATPSTLDQNRHLAAHRDLDTFHDPKSRAAWMREHGATSRGRWLLTALLNSNMLDVFRTEALTLLRMHAGHVRALRDNLAVRGLGDRVADIDRLLVLA